MSLRVLLQFVLVVLGTSICLGCHLQPKRRTHLGLRAALPEDAASSDSPLGDAATENDATCSELRQCAKDGDVFVSSNAPSVMSPTINTVDADGAGSLCDACRNDSGSADNASLRDATFASADASAIDTGAFDSSVTIGIPDEDGGEPTTINCSGAGWGTIHDYTVRYTFSGIWTESAKAQVRAAMSAWRIASGDQLQFVESSTAPHAVFERYGDHCTSEKNIDVDEVLAFVHPSVCPTAGDRRRAIGQLLGLPLTVQRYDSERYAADAAGPGMQEVLCRTDPAVGVFDFDSIMSFGTSWTPHSDGAKIQSLSEEITPSDVSAFFELQSSTSNWSRFKPLISEDPGARFPLDLDLATQIQVVGSPALVGMGVRSLDVVARGNDGVLYQKRLRHGAWVDGYWQPIAAGFSAEPAAVKAANTVELVALASDGRLKWLTQSDDSWSTPQDIGVPDGEGALSAPALAFTADTNLVAFTLRGSALFSRTLSPAMTSWSEIGCCFAGKPAVIGRGTSQLDLLVPELTTSKLSWNRFQDGSWRNWQALDIQVAPGTGAAVVTSTVGTLTLVFTAPDGNLWSSWYNRQNWAAPYPLGGRISGSPAAIWDSQSMHVVANIDDTGVWYRATPPPPDLAP